LPGPSTKDLEDEEHGRALGELQPRSSNSRERSPIGAGDRAAGRVGSRTWDGRCLAPPSATRGKASRTHVVKSRWVSPRAPVWIHDRSTHL